MRLWNLESIIPLIIVSNQTKLHRFDQNFKTFVYLQIRVGIYSFHCIITWMMVNDLIEPMIIDRYLSINKIFYMYDVRAMANI